MRRVVPFIGEQQIARADTELERSKRSSGRVIDEVVSNADAESSWDDTINPESPPKNPSAGVGVSRPGASGKGKMLVKTNAPRQGFDVSGAHKNQTQTTRSTTFVPAGMPTMEWVAVNNGRGMRITICGNIDHNLRSEWNRLLAEIEGNEAGEFEFNLTQAPSLSLTGLGMLLLFKERKTTRYDAIRLCHCNREVAQLLHWTGMDKYFVIQADQQHDT